MKDELYLMFSLSVLGNQIRVYLILANVYYSQVMNLFVGALYIDKSTEFCNWLA
jgi:hypothetical protein